MLYGYGPHNHCVFCGTHNSTQVNLHITNRYLNNWGGKKKNFLALFKPADVFILCLQGGKDDGVHVTFEDQQKINVYARKCNKLAELGEEIKTKQVGKEIWLKYFI